MHRGGSAGGGAGPFAGDFAGELAGEEARAMASAEFGRAGGRSGREGGGGIGGGGAAPSVLLALDDFVAVAADRAGGGAFASPPFSFYAAARGAAHAPLPAASASASAPSTAASRLRQALGSRRSSPSAARSRGDCPGPPCWLRLTRAGGRGGAAAAATGAPAPPLPPPLPAGAAVAEVRRHRRRLLRGARRDRARARVGAMYDCLFEVAQGRGAADGGGSDPLGPDELVLGLGCARLAAAVGDPAGGGGGGGGGRRWVAVSGPLLEVRAEVELATDGALLVRPCEHTGVELNRDVVGAVAAAAGGDGSTAALAALHRAAAELEPGSLSPAQPSTYSPLLRRIAVELCAGGRFVPSARAPAYGGGGLLVTDSWCLYRRPRPSSVWARDAQGLAELVSRGDGAGSDAASPAAAAPSLPPPLAARALTHGPGALSGAALPGHAPPPPSLAGLAAAAVRSLLRLAPLPLPTPPRPLFPLPASASQRRIHALLASGAPAVVVEGPPGCGKTHTIANVVCSYLARGRRVLVTSKGAPALSVLGGRLPDCVRELCVDATASEAEGMQQLQRTVERLAERVAAGTDRAGLCSSLEEELGRVGEEVERIDRWLRGRQSARASLLRAAAGRELAEEACELALEVPWLAATVGRWPSEELAAFAGWIEQLAAEAPAAYPEVSGYSCPPRPGLVSAAAARAGRWIPGVRGAAVGALARVPLLGSATGALEYEAKTERDLDSIRLYGEVPASRTDWQIVHDAMNYNATLCSFYEDSVSNLVEKEGWPVEKVTDQSRDGFCFRESFVGLIQTARRVREIQDALLPRSDFDQSHQAQLLEARRRKLVSSMKDLDEKLVEGRIVTQLSNMFSAEAQSALIKFAQLAGRAKFRSNAQTSRLTQRQQRHRQAYLEAFEQCVRYIPCWILTTNQINDYLPAEFGLFDLVIIDEASQSNITALPSMLRGKQWLVVGDGKQVSPTESFVSEEQIESLRATLPDSPLRECFLPGSSFFDMCAQAYPVGRVTLREHFRSSPDIIRFSNETYYQGSLHPLRLPTSAERMSPSLIDVYLRNGCKVGKVNEVECDKIVDMIKLMTDEAKESLSRPRSIGVICLVGDEQGRLIRGRLLDAVGPETFKEHNILIGEPPAFQGSERDVVFLSMVSSPGSVATQSQLMNHQRVNVALSRARDRMVLVRSINRSQVPSVEDVKIAILDFFSEHGTRDSAGDRQSSHRHPFTIEKEVTLQAKVVGLISKYLSDYGFSVRPMGLVWSGAICVENERTGERAAIAVEGCGEMQQEWAGVLSEQRAIERVGWQCLRVDALSWLLDESSSKASLHSFLRAAEVDTPLSAVEVDMNMVLEEQEEDPDEAGEEDDGTERIGPADRDGAAAAENDAVVVSSNDEGGAIDISSDGSSASATAIKLEDDDNDGLDPNQYGDVVQLQLPVVDNQLDRTESDIATAVNSDVDAGPTWSSGGKRSRDGDEGEVSVSEGIEGTDGRKEGRRRRRRRMDSHSRDGRWYPGHEPDSDDTEMDDGDDEDWEDEGVV